MRLVWRSMPLMLCLWFMACSSGNNDSSTADVDSGNIELSERESLLYSRTLSQVEAAEQAFSAIETGEQDNITKVLNDIRKLQYDYNEKSMNEATREYCEALNERLTQLKERAKEFRSSQTVSTAANPRSIALKASAKPQLMEGKVSYPYYLEAGDMLYYTVEAETSATVDIYNYDKQSRIKHTAGRKVTDSLRINYSAIYLITVKPQGREYVSVAVDIKNENQGIARRPKITSERIACNKGDFGAESFDGIKMTNIFEEPRKFTLRGQIKAAFSGTARAIVAIPVPAGATNILYSMRISTSEQPISSDGRFHENLGHSYRRIEVFNIPVYESTRRSGLIDMLLDDNRPIREEDAYCNMYVFRNQAQAKQFQDGTKSASQLSYDVDYSTLGTQSCNGSIPTNGSKTIYLGFENERMRYANYLWVEAVGVVPTTEYYTTKYSIQ